MNVPFADLHLQYLSLKTEIDTAIADVIRTSAFIRGPYVEAFEKEFAAAMGVENCVSCANGTDAIYIAMHALGVKRGDEVITTAQSWISTSESISQAGGRPVFCDIDPETHTIDVSQIEARITPNTVGIIPVHLYGQPADMEAIMEIARKHGLWVIEDCAQAHLATVNGRKVGTFGNVATFSFYPGKNLGAMGDAGAITTNDADLARKMGMFARHGGLVKGEHFIEGINSRLDGLQAAILSVKLPHLEGWTRRRQEVAALYDRDLAGIEGVTIPTVAAGRQHVYHLYVIQHERRDELQAFLKDRGVQTAINYRTALPFLPCYEPMGHTPQDYPVAARTQDRILSIPISAEITEEQRQAVVEAIGAFGS
ncbi:MAG: DegT/DnrJ/EryC1/StrS family aminotransferase [Brevundimonas sp.]|nr:DegT/DnrJ/EryC1/StrS family aminotransferase [Brevundimonas sp.]